jgi:hypothetical protein
VERLIHEIKNTLTYIYYTCLYSRLTRSTKILTNKNLFFLQTTKIGTHENKSVYSIRRKAVGNQILYFEYQYPVSVTHGVVITCIHMLNVKKCLVHLVQSCTNTISNKCNKYNLIIYKCVFVYLSLCWVFTHYTHVHTAVPSIRPRDYHGGFRIGYACIQDKAVGSCITLPIIVLPEPHFALLCATNFF